MREWGKVTVQFTSDSTFSINKKVIAWLIFHHSLCAEITHKNTVEEEGCQQWFQHCCLSMLREPQRQTLDVEDAFPPVSHCLLQYLFESLVSYLQASKNEISPPRSLLLVLHSFKPNRNLQLDHISSTRIYI